MNWKRFPFPGDGAILHRTAAGGVEERLAYERLLLLPQAVGRGRALGGPSTGTPLPEARSSSREKGLSIPHQLVGNKNLFLNKKKSAALNFLERF